MENKETKQEKKVSLSYTKEEIEIKVRDLENDEEVQLYLKTINGQRKYDEMVSLINGLEKLG